MGTHISRVKSVDLDAWTDEQLQSVLKWGNSRANKYWEAKLAPGHVPSESKIENFIRTKYESKRWVAEGPIPDPSTLEADGDDDVPLSLVKEKQAIERSASQRSAVGGPSQIRRAPQQDLFADDNEPPRSSSAAPVVSRPPPKAEPAPPKQTKPADSLLGLDFFGTEAPPPNRPSSAAPTPGVQSRPDLKQSILSLYATVPRPQPTQQQQPSHASSGSFGVMQSAMGGFQSPVQQSPPAQKTSFGGMNDAFAGLSFSSNPTSPGFQQAAPQQQKPSAFSSFGNLSSHKGPSQTSPPANLSGGSFFDTKPTPKPSQQPPQPSQGFSSSNGFGAFDSAPSPTPAAGSSSGMADLFDFSTPAAPPAAPKPTMASPPPQQSVFNLSQPAAQPKPAVPAAMPTMGGWGNDDAWGSNDAWSSAKSPTTAPAPAAPAASSGNFGWGSSGTSLANQSIVPGGGGTFSPTTSAPPKVSADEDFGGWSSAPSAAPATSTNQQQQQPKPAAFGASEDLFSNVWG